MSIEISTLPSPHKDELKFCLSHLLSSRAGSFSSNSTCPKAVCSIPITREVPRASPLLVNGYEQRANTQLSCQAQAQFLEVPCVLSSNVTALEQLDVNYVQEELTRDVPKASKAIPSSESRNMPE